MTAPTERSVLNQSPLPSEKYNSLPQVNTAHDAATTPEGRTARTTLLKIISDNGLNDLFSLHLLHKYFDVPETQVMVYQTVCGPRHPVYQILAPQQPEMVSPLQPAYFLATLNDGMQAYEYTTDDQPEVSQYDSFVSTFAQAVNELGMQDVFALGVRPYSSLTSCTEIEIPEYGATVFVEDFELPDSFQTDWTNPVRTLDNVDTDLHQAKTRGQRLYVWMA